MAPRLREPQAGCAMSPFLAVLIFLRLPADGSMAGSAWRGGTGHSHRPGEAQSWSEDEWIGPATRILGACSDDGLSW